MTSAGLCHHLLAVEDDHRNQPGGFWVCGDTPAAARETITGHTTSTTIPLSDGPEGHHGPDATPLLHDDLHTTIPGCAPESGCHRMTSPGVALGPRLNEYGSAHCDAAQSDIITHRAPGYWGWRAGAGLSFS